jgi:hypothetical protein
MDLRFGFRVRLRLVELVCRRVYRLLTDLTVFLEEKIFFSHSVNLG